MDWFVERSSRDCREWNYDDFNLADFSCSVPEDLLKTAFIFHGIHDLTINCECLDEIGDYDEPIKNYRIDTENYHA